VTRHQMLSLFRRAAVPDHFYVMDGGLGTGECYGLEATASGWQVYYSERGGKSLLGAYPDEDAACRALIGHVEGMMRQHGRGAIGQP